jgi:predicted Zn finger-like uncharacterized protein
MQTYCPHCSTHFRITEEQIDAAEGHVRCGVCNEIFNIYEAVEAQSLENEQQALLNDSNDTIGVDEQLSDISESAPVSKNSFNENASSDNAPAEPVEIDDDSGTVDKSDDFFNDDDDNSLDYIVPDELRDSKPLNQHATTKTVLWSAGILLLISSLVLEYIWFNRDQFQQFPALLNKIESLCARLECNTLAQRDPTKIRLMSRNVISHPNEQDVLIINITLKNNAEFEQAYPVIQVDFSDRRGGIIAARRFYPDEYLADEYLTRQSQTNESKQAHLLQPDTETNITLEIKDPGDDAVTYEFAFL